MPTFKNIFLISVCVSLNALGAAAKSIDGFFVLWHRKPCLANANCSLPQPLNPPQFFNLQLELGLEQSLKPGTYPAKPVTFKVEDYIVRIELYAVVKSSGNDSYIVTQEFIKDTKNNLIAQCSQYNTLESTNFFPVGSCSGIHKDRQLGISFIKPGPSGKPSDK